MSFSCEMGIILPFSHPAGLVSLDYKIGAGDAFHEVFVHCLAQEGPNLGWYL